MLALAGWSGLVIGGLAGRQVRSFERSALYWPLPMSREVKGLRCGETPIEQVRVTTADGEDLSAWWIGPTVPTATTVLYLHGNGANLMARGPWICKLRLLPAAVLALDWRGYGSSTGTPSEEGLYEDARAAWRHLTADRGIPAASIVVYGESLGGAPAAVLAAEVEPRMLVLQSTFTRLPDLVRTLFGRPIAALAPSRFDTAAALANVAAPVLILHGTRDELVPPAMAEALAVAAADARLVKLPGAGHNNVTALYSGRVLEEWRRRLAASAPPQK